MQTQGNTVLITGGDRGIGLALTKAFAKDNKVIICGRDEKALWAVQLAVPEVDTTQCDLTIRSEREELVKWAILNHPELNVLVNNAGVSRRVDMKHDSFDFDTIEQELVTDLHVPIELTLRLLPQLRQRPRAAVVNVTTGLVYGTAAWTPIYSAAKLGFHAFIRDLRYQLKGTSVQVFEVLPPFVETDMIRDLGIEHPPNAVSPEEVARTVLYDMARDQKEIRIGPTKALYALSRVAPEAAYRLVNRGVEKIQADHEKKSRKAA